MQNELSNKLFDKYAKIQKVFLELEGFDLSHCLSSVDVMLSYFNLEMKTISPIKRTVLLSKEFKCPPYLKDRFEKIKLMIEQGEDCSGFLSRLAGKPNKYDPLLYDWGIYHLHFYNFKTSSKPEQTRSNELLFMFIQNETAYLIDIKDHNSFCDIDLLNIIDSSWPHLTDHLCVGYSDSTDTDIPKEGIQKLRIAGVNSTFTLKNGKILMSMMLGGGIATSGDSSFVSERVTDLQRDFDTIGNYLNDILTEKIFDKKIQFKAKPTLVIDRYRNLYISDNVSKTVPLDVIYEKAKLNESNRMIELQRTYKNETRRSPIDP